ncbi:outer membrane beta-barrel protein [Ruegeria halocynthiae]|uniref:outer membrane beta-barrel protein n=1 Tax=Ruegeria halocynthiae TaxID=985054 RepID=UPI00068B09BD|nr:outer membrane beta-barrel protein [Ruegeria halocynthiae]
MTRTAAWALTTSVAAAGPVWSGGIENSDQDVSIIFAPGTVIEGTYFYSDIEISGTDFGMPSGNTGGGLSSGVINFKHDVTDKIALAFIIDEPINDFSRYRLNNGNPNFGTDTDIRSISFTALAKYRFDNNVSVYGGVRTQRAKLDINVPDTAIPPFGYELDADTGYDFGYVVGVGYEIPEIAFRASLTYNSKVSHDDGDATLFPSSFSTSTSFTAEFPQSLDLQVETGVSANTLVFGRVRWRDWSEGSLELPLQGEALDFKDSTFYQLGFSHAITDNWVGGLSLTYEDDHGGPLLTTGSIATLTAHGGYITDTYYVIGALSYSDIGDKDLGNGTVYKDNDAVTFSLTVGYTF